MIGIAPKLPLAPDATDGYYKLTKTLTETLKQNLKMLILTAPGERMMDPAFGVGLRNFLFEHTPASLIKTRITQQVARYIPAISITKLDIIRQGVDSETLLDDDVHTLLVRLLYIIPPLNIDNQVLELQF